MTYRIHLLTSLFLNVDHVRISHTIIIYFFLMLCLYTLKFVYFMYFKWYHGDGLIKYDLCISVIKILVSLVVCYSILIEPIKNSLNI